MDKTYALSNHVQVSNGINLIGSYLGNINADDFVLDLGCGAGDITHFLAKYGGNVTGLDVSVDMIEHAKKYNCGFNISFEIVDLQVGLDQSHVCVYM